jgi:Transcriptional regulator DIP2311-like, C-terminal domain
LAQPVLTRIGGSASLKPAQEIVLARIEQRGTCELTRSDYEEISGVSRSQAAYDIAELVSLGILERVGSGRSTRYLLPSGGAGRPKKWTEERIRAELREFHAEVGRWPRAADFRESGRSDLYVAACRNGGIERWANELAPEEVPGKKPGAPNSRTWLSYAIVLAACLGVLTVTGTPQGSQPGSGGSHVARSAAAKPPVGRGQAPTVARTPTAALVLTAGDDVELTVRRRGATGRAVFAGLLLRGASVRVSAPKIWLDLSSPAGLEARLNGQRLRLPARPAILVITAAGIQAVRARPTAPATSDSSQAAATTATTPTAGTTPVAAASASTGSPSPDSQPSPDPPPPGPTPDPGRRSP